MRKDGGVQVTDTRFLEIDLACSADIFRSSLSDPVESQSYSHRPHAMIPRRRRPPDGGHHAIVSLGSNGWTYEESRRRRASKPARSGKRALGRGPSARDAIARLARFRILLVHCLLSCAVEAVIYVSSTASSRCISQSIFVVVCRFRSETLPATRIVTVIQSVALLWEEARLRRFLAISGGRPSTACVRPQMRLCKGEDLSEQRRETLIPLPPSPSLFPAHTPAALRIGGAHRTGGAKGPEAVLCRSTCPLVSFATHTPVQPETLSPTPSQPSSI